MGAIQEPTRAMGPYRIEIRSESFYITRVEAEKCQVPSRHEAVVPAADLPALSAAFQQVTGHAAWRAPDWKNGDPTDTTWALPPDSQGEPPALAWSVRRDGENLHVRGPWIVSAERGLIFGEIRYLDLPHLSAALAALDT